MQTTWTELFRPLKELPYYSLFSHSTLPLTPSDPVTFFAVSLRVCYWWELRATVFSKAACQQTLSSCSDSLISSAAVFPLGDLDWTPAQYTHERHKSAQIHANMHACAHGGWVKSLCVSSRWERSQVVYFFMFLNFLPFFSLWRKEKMMWGWVYSPADFNVRHDLSGSKN